ncbi:SPOR domain-containing protein [Burkholderiaceae bacterium DAT-1]|nr:SPOR domain-containing protein [Burkholderiaceae bacterium DAT-1]
MRNLFIVLLLGNLAFWGYSSLSTPPAPIDWKVRQVAADKVRLIAPGEPMHVETAPVAEPATQDEKQAASVVAEEKSSGEDKQANMTKAPEADLHTSKESVAQKDDKAATKSVHDKVVEKASEKMCVVWRGIDPEQLSIVKRKLASVPGKLDFDVHLPEGPSRFWVYIPPRASLADAQRKAQEITERGMEDNFVVNDGGKWQNAISLGVFSSREAAERRLADLKQHNVQSAIIRAKDDSLRTATLTFKAMDVGQADEIAKLNKSARGSVIASQRCEKH